MLKKLWWLHTTWVWLDNILDSKVCFLLSALCNFPPRYQFPHCKKVTKASFALCFRGFYVVESKGEVARQTKYSIQVFQTSAYWGNFMDNNSRRDGLEARIVWLQIWDSWTWRYLETLLSLDIRWDFYGSCEYLSTTAWFPAESFMTILLALLKDGKGDWWRPGALGTTTEGFKAKVAKEAWTRGILWTTTEERCMGLFPLTFLTS